MDHVQTTVYNYGKNGKIYTSYKYPLSFKCCSHVKAKTRVKEYRLYTVTDPDLEKRGGGGFKKHFFGPSDLSLV